MKNQTIKLTLLNILFYVLGFLIVGLGVNLMETSNLGMGAWDTVTFNIHSFITSKLGVESITLFGLIIPVKVGYISMTISFTIFLAVIIYRKRVNLLFMLVPVLLVGTFINFWYYQVFEDMELTSYVIRILFYVLGLSTIPMGLVLVVKSSFPAFVFDEWTFMMVDIFKTKNVARVRLGIEIFGITVGTIFGALTFWQTEGHLGTVNLGTLLAALVFGQIFAFYLKIFPKIKYNTNIFTKVFLEL